MLRVVVHHEAMRIREDISNEWEKSLLQNVNVEKPTIVPVNMQIPFRPRKLIPAQT